MHEIIAKVIACLIMIESGGEINPESAVGDNGNAIGVLQLHEVYVDEANRIERRLAPISGRKARTWTYRDRYSRIKSIEMAEVTLAYHYMRGEKDPIRLGARHHRPYGEVDSRYIKLMEKEWVKQ